MNNISISVIIPIYNAEKYVKRAIDSVIYQDDVEIVLVNDGSIDSSGEICDKYASNYKNIKVVHKENGGLSTARNAGLKKAEGKYIVFLDADDFLERDTIDTLSAIIEKEAPDCIDFGWKYINDYGEETYNINKLEKNRILGKEVIKNKILPPLLNLKKDEEHFIYDFSTNKAYKSEIIRNQNVYFDEKRRTWEDRVFLIQYLKYCETYYSINQCFYNYVSVPNSLSRRYDIQFFDLILSNYKKYIEWFGNEYDFNTQYANNYWCHSIENMIYRSLKEEKQKEQIRKNIVRILKDEQVVKWYANRNPENEQEAQTSQLVVQGDVAGAISLYEKVVKKQKKQAKWNQIKAKMYAVRKVLKL